MNFSESVRNVQNCDEMVYFLSGVFLCRGVSSVSRLQCVEKASVERTSSRKPEWLVSAITL